MRTSNVARAVTKILRPFVRLPRVVQACILGSVFAVLMVETPVQQKAWKPLGDEAIKEYFGLVSGESFVALLSPVTLNAAREVLLDNNGDGKTEQWSVAIREDEPVFSSSDLMDTDLDGSPDMMMAAFAGFRAIYRAMDTDEDGVADHTTFQLWKNADGIDHTNAFHHSRYQYWDLDCDGRIDQVSKVDGQDVLGDGRDLEKRQFIVFENHWLPCAGIEYPTESDTHRHSIEVGGEWMWVDFADGRWQTEKIPRENLPE